MVYFRKIKKTKHYIEEHEKEVPWYKVVETIFKSSKNMRRKRGSVKIKSGKYYILCKIENEVLWVINAKKRG